MKISRENEHPMYADNYYFYEAFSSMTRNQRRQIQGKLKLAEARIKDLESKISEKEPRHE